MLSKFKWLKKIFSQRAEFKTALWTMLKTMRIGGNNTLHRFI